MLLQVILEGLGLGILLVLVCAVGIRKGAVGMVHLYSSAVQQRCVKLGLTTHEKIKRNSLVFKAVCVPGYIAYVLVCVYGINGVHGFAVGFWQLLVILSVMNLIDRFFDRWLLGGAHERMDDPRNRGSEALHYCKRQTEKMAFRYGRYGSHSGGAGGNDDSTVIGKTLLSVTFSGFLQGSGTTG